MMDCSYNKRLVINTFVSKANFHCIGMALRLKCLVDFLITIKKPIDTRNSVR